MDWNELFGQPNTWMSIRPIEELIKDETEELKGTLESYFYLLTWQMVRLTHRHPPCVCWYTFLCMEYILYGYILAQPKTCGTVPSNSGFPPTFSNAKAELAFCK